LCGQAYKKAFARGMRNAAVVDAAAGNATRPGAIGAGIHFPFDDAFLTAADVDGTDRTPAVRRIQDAVLDRRGRFKVAVSVTPAALKAAAW
jgi:hypothetical protein